MSLVTPPAQIPFAWVMPNHNPDHNPNPNRHPNPGVIRCKAGSFGATWWLMQKRCAWVESQWHILYLPSHVSMQCMHSAILFYQFCPSVCRSVRPMPVLCLNGRTYCHTFRRSF